MQHLLLALNAESNNILALSKAAELASHLEAKITIVMAVFDSGLMRSPSIDRNTTVAIQMRLIQKQHEWISGILETVDQKTQQRIQAVEIEWHSNLLTAIKYVCQKYTHFDMIIKGCDHHNLIAKKFFTPLDWHLIRSSSIPVLLVKASNTLVRKKILLALDVDQDAVEQTQRLLNMGVKISTLLNAELHIAHAYPHIDAAILINLNGELSMENLQEKVQSEHEDALYQQLSQHPINHHRVHLKSGDVSAVIPYYIEELSIDLLIMGTEGREGLTNFISTNTSETIIDQVSADVLVLH